MAERFELREEHVKLLAAAYVSWNECEFGAPGIDCKRPYGHSSHSETMTAIAKILGEQRVTCPHCGESPAPEGDDADEQRWEKLHRETGTALQIILRCQTFEPGVYECDEYRTNWARVLPPQRNVE